MNNLQQQDFQTLDNQSDDSENVQEVSRKAQGPVSSPASPRMENLMNLQSSRYQQQSQREYCSQYDNAQSINKSEYIPQAIIQNRLSQCPKCRGLQERLQSIKQENEMYKESIQIVEKQYNTNYEQIKVDKRIFRENFKKNIKLLVTFLQKKYQESDSQLLMKDFYTQIDSNLLESGHQTHLNQYLQTKIKDFQSQEDVLARINIELNAAVNDNDRLRQQTSQVAQLKLGYEALQKHIKELEKFLSGKITQEGHYITKLQSNQEQIERLNAQIKHLSQELYTATQNITTLNEQLSQEIKNVKYSRASKQKIELQGQLSKCQDERFILDKQLKEITETLNQEKRIKTQQIHTLSEKNKNLVIELEDQKKYYVQRLSDYQNDCRNVEQKALSAVNDLISRFDKNIANNKEKINQEFSVILNIIRSEAENSNKVMDQIIVLQEKINALVSSQTKYQLSLAAKDLELKDGQYQINRLNAEKQKLITDFDHLKLAYEQEFETINQLLQQKLASNIQQYFQHYSKIITDQEERTKLKLQTVVAELELMKQMKIFDHKRFEDQKQKHLKQVKLLKKHIQNVKIKCIRDEERKELELNAKRNQIILETQKLRHVEATSQNQQRLLQQYHSQIALFKKTLTYIHKQLDNKSLKEVIALIDEQQQTQYHRSLLDLINCIIYQQNQKENELSSLNLQLRALKRQNQNISANSSQQSIKVKESNRKLMAYQKNQAALAQKIAILEQQIGQLKNSTNLLRQSNEQISTKLKHKTQQLQLITSLDTQGDLNTKNLQSENFQLKNRVEELQKEIASNKKVYDEMSINLKNYYKNQKTLMEKNSAGKAQAEALQSKIKALSEQNQSLKQKYKSQDNIGTEMVTLKATIIKMEQQNRKQKQKSEILLQNKLSYERQLLNMKEKLNKAYELNKQLTNNLKIREEQAKISRPSPIKSRQVEKVTVNDEKIRQLQSKNQILQADIRQMKKNKDTLEETIYQLKRQIDEKRPQKAPNEINKELSWSQSQEYMKGYENMIQSLRQEKAIQEEEIQALKAKIKRLQGNNKAPKSYISPGKSAIMVERSPPKVQKISENIQKVEIPQQNMPKIKRYAVFGVSCLLDEQQASRGFLLKKIQELFMNKKIAETRLVYKLTEASKAFSFATLIPKAQLQSQTFIFLFSTKTDIFGVLSYKKDAISKQTAMLFSTNTQKVVSKRPTGDSVTATAVMVEFSGELNIGNGHLKMKSSSRSLMVKEVLGKYFEPYEKKQIYGKDYWRDEMTIDLTEFQIHKIYLK